MLINYSWSNYKSFRYKNQLTFVASKIRQFDENNVSLIDKTLLNKNRILRSLVIVGPNASGKTNTLKSVSYVRQNPSLMLGIWY